MISRGKVYISKAMLDDRSIWIVLRPLAIMYHGLRITPTTRHTHHRVIVALTRIAIGMQLQRRLNMKQSRPVELVTVLDNVNLFVFNY